MSYDDTIAVLATVPPAAMIISVIVFGFGQAMARAGKWSCLFVFAWFGMWYLMLRAGVVQGSTGTMAHWAIAYAALAAGFALVLRLTRP